MDRLLKQAAQPGQRATDECLDGELLAAFMDGGLRPDERARLEAHISDCARCLQLTAAMVRTEPAIRPEPRRSWFRTGWLVPLTAAAVGLAAWVIVRDPRGIESPAVQEAIATRTPEAAAPPPLPSETSKATVPQFREERESRRDAASEPGRPADRAAAGNRAVEQKGLADTATFSPPAAETTAAARSVPPAAPQPALSAQETAALARDGVTAKRQEASAMQVVVSPDPAVRWRFSATNVEKTTDGGATWTLQDTGATGFVAGSAPSADVLWLAARAGVVLLTTDGRTWQRADLPDKTSDPITITSTDGRSATVTTAAGSTYRTSDGGRTWLLQEIPAAPF